MRKLHAFGILGKYDNCACNKSTVSLATCVCDCMLHTDRCNDICGLLINIFERRKGKRLTCPLKSVLANEN